MKWMENKESIWSPLKANQKLPFRYSAATAATAKSLQSCRTLCDLIDGSPPGYPIPGILQARTLEWVAISFSNAWKWKVKVKSLSRVRLLATPWTTAYQAPPYSANSWQIKIRKLFLMFYISPHYSATLFQKENYIYYTMKAII